MRLAAAVVVTLLAMVGLAAGASDRTPRLTLRDHSPLTVRGTQFAGGERVRVSVRTPALSVRTVGARSDGTFVVTFAGVSVDRCSVIRIAAAGAGGSRAGLKLLPAPLCPPA